MKALKYKWNIWRLGGINSDKELKKFLPVCDFNPVNITNAEILRLLFNLNKSVEIFVDNKAVDSNRSALSYFNMALSALPQLISEKKELGKLINCKSSELHTFSNNMVDIFSNAYDHFTKGMFLNSYQLVCDLINYFIEVVSNFDVKFFSVENFITNVDPRERDLFKGYLSRTDVNTLQPKEDDVTNEILNLYSIVQVYPDDFFRQEDHIQSLRKSLQVYFEGIKTFLSKYHPSSIPLFNKYRTPFVRKLIEIEEEVSQRTKIDLEMYKVHFLGSWIILMNRFVSQVVRLDEISISYLGGIDDPIMLSDLVDFEGHVDEKELNLLRCLIDSFVTDDETAKELVEDCHNIVTPMFQLAKVENKTTYLNNLKEFFDSFIKYRTDLLNKERVRDTDTKAILILKLVKAISAKGLVS